MILKLKITPQKYTASTKDSLVHKITSNRCFTMGMTNKISYNGYAPLGLGLNRNNNSLLVYNLHKVRKKTIQKKDKKNKTKSTVINTNHWIAYVYKFDLDVLGGMGIKSIKQQARNFKIEFKS